MRSTFRRMMVAVVTGLVLGVASPGWSLEADQFTLPPEPLADLGPELDAKVRLHLQRIIDELNERIDEAEANAAAASDPDQRRRYGLEAAAWLSHQRVPHALWRQFGMGWPEAWMEVYVRHADFQHDKPVRFNLAYYRSKFGLAAAWKPLLIIGVAPTINVHDTKMGTDKLGHFFAQGYEYYRIYHRGLDAGLSRARSRGAAVAHGMRQERSYLGYWVSGTYSNADLAANYAGFMFYRNMTRPVRVDGRELAPILVREGGRWAFNDEARDDLLGPFMSDHLNEAMNPAHYEAPMRWTIHQVLAHDPARRAAWRAHYGLTRDEERERTHELAAWHGQDYGHGGFDNVLTPAKVFFDDEEDALPREARGTDPG